MSLFDRKFATTVLLVVALATCARAAFNGESLGNMDLDWDLFDSVGGQFMATVAYDQFNQMVSLPGSNVRRPPPMLQEPVLPTAGSSPNASIYRTRTPPPPRSWAQLTSAQPMPLAPQQDYFTFTELELSGIMQEQPPLGSTSLLHPLQAQTEPAHYEQHRGPLVTNKLYRPQHQQSIAQEVHQEAGIAMQPPSRSSRNPRPSLDASNMYGYPGAPQARPAYGQSEADYESQQPVAEESCQYVNADPRLFAGAQFDGAQFDGKPISMPMGAFARHTSQPSTSMPQILPAELISNPNYHPDVSTAVGSMQGWARRASTTGDQMSLRIETNHLIPPDTISVDRAPTSASSTGSSTRPGSRRSREEMIGPWICGYCRAGFPSQGELTHHCRSHTPYWSRQHVCETCCKRFQYKKDLARHAPRHDPNRKRYHCHFRGCKYFTKGFGRQDHLERHLMTQHPANMRVDTPQQASHHLSALP